MDYQEYQWFSRDNKKLFASSWLPEKKSESVILLVHGLGEHIGRYDSWAKLFNEAGYSFLAFDQRGHGRSEGKRGHISSFDILLEDINLLFSKSDELFPGQKKILYGHSMGGNLVLNYIIKYNTPVSALIVTSPWLKLYKEPGYPVLLFSRIMKNILPSLTLSNGLKSDQMTHDPDINSSYSPDPLVHHRISINMFYELYQAGLFALKNESKINYPLLLMHGSADTITSCEASKNFIMNTNKKSHFKLWENQYHELHNELIKKDVFNYITNWLHNL